MKQWMNDWGWTLLCCICGGVIGWCIQPHVPPVRPVQVIIIYL